MPLSSQKQVLVGLDVLAAKALRRARREYDRVTLGTLRDQIERSGSAREAMERLGSVTALMMPRTSLATALEQAAVNAALIGRTAARPRKRRTAKRANRNGRAG